MIQPLIQFAQRAGELLMLFHRAGEISIRYKQNHSPVTAADLASHVYLVQCLTKEFGLPIVSEEGSLPAVESLGPEFFLVDPLDGTRGFIEGQDEFAVCIALIRHGRPVAGVIHAPALDETYAAEMGKGAFLIAAGERSPLPTRESGETILVRSRHHDSPEVDLFQKEHGLFRSQILGSALKFGRLAAGEVTIYPRYQGTNEWDVAAGDLILNEAGGGFLEMAGGKAPVYGKPTYRQAPFLAWGPHWRGGLK